PHICSATLDPGQVVRLTATPGSGALFRGWGGACAGVRGTGCTVTMRGDLTVTAAFAPPVTLTVDDPGPVGFVRGPGIDCPPTCSTTLHAGDRIVLTAVPDGDDFLAWGDDCIGFLNNPKCTLTMDANRHVSATFGFIERCPPICPGGQAVTTTG